MPTEDFDTNYPLVSVLMTTYNRENFISEIPMYEQGEKVIGLVFNAITAADTIEINLYMLISGC